MPRRAKGGGLQGGVGMPKVTEEIVYELTKQAAEDTGLSVGSQTFSQVGEETQQYYKNYAKRINDYLTYGHVPARREKK